MKIYLYTNHGHEYPCDVTLDVDAVPRVGENLQYNDVQYIVMTVIHDLDKGIIHVRVK